MNHVIGVDFDNTLVNYDDVIHELALQRGLIGPGTTRQQKKDIRDDIRKLPDGEVEWQKLQAAAYGARMEDALLFDGVAEFFELCRRFRVMTYIISHKTEFARLDETRANLRAVALAWLAKKRFFDADGLGFSTSDVYFESSRGEKIERIRRLACTHFIDDLEETFLEASFPPNVEKILFAPGAPHAAVPGMKIVHTWKEMGDYFFPAGH